MLSVIPWIVIAAVVVLLLVLGRRRTTPVLPDRTELIEVQNEWRAPAELLACPMPRPVQLRWQGKVMAAITGLVLVFAVFVTSTAISFAVREETLLSNLEHQGVAAEAEILKKWVVRRDKSTRRYVLYRFQAAGRTYEAQATVASASYEGVRVGDRVPVRYVASRPEHSRLALERDLTAVRLGAWLTLLLPALFVPFLWMVSYPLRVQRKLVQWGQPAGAVVTKVSPTKGGMHVAYQFLEMAGNVVSGSTVVDRAEAPNPGQKVTILYDPQKPSRNTLYPAPMVQVAQPRAPGLD